jgi:hypothetical protein
VRILSSRPDCSNHAGRGSLTPPSFLTKELGPPVNIRQGQDAFAERDCLTHADPVAAISLALI